MSVAAHSPRFSQSSQSPLSSLDQCLASQCSLDENGNQVDYAATHCNIPDTGSYRAGYLRYQRRSLSDGGADVRPAFHHNAWTNGIIHPTDQQNNANRVSPPTNHVSAYRRSTGRPLGSSKSMRSLPVSASNHQRVFDSVYYRSNNSRQHGLFFGRPASPPKRPNSFPMQHPNSLSPQHGSPGYSSASMTCSPPTGTSVPVCALPISQPSAMSPQHLITNAGVTNAQVDGEKGELLVEETEDETVHLHKHHSLPSRTPSNSLGLTEAYVSQQVPSATNPYTPGSQSLAALDEESGSDSDPAETHPNKFAIAIEQHYNRDCGYMRQNARSGPQVKIVKKSGTVYSPTSPPGTGSEVSQELTRKYYRKDLVRVCVCGQYETKEALLANRGRDNDADGYEVHYNNKCRWKSYEDFKTKQRVIIRLCKCYKPSF